MRRGDLARVALPGSYGKPRPALIIQSDLFAEHPSTTLLPITSDLRDLPVVRIRLHPTPTNGLKTVSEIMVDKAHSVPRDRIGAVFGRIKSSELRAVERALVVFLGLA